MIFIKWDTAVLYALMFLSVGMGCSSIPNRTSNDSASPSRSPASSTYIDFNCAIRGTPNHVDAHIKGSWFSRAITEYDLSETACNSYASELNVYFKFLTEESARKAVFRCKSLPKEVVHLEIEIDGQSSRAVTFFGKSSKDRYDQCVDLQNGLNGAL